MNDATGHVQPSVTESDRQIVSDTLWQSLSPLSKFAALGLGYQPPIRPACRCSRCGR